MSTTLTISGSTRYGSSDTTELRPDTRIRCVLEESGADHRKTAGDQPHFWSDDLRRPFACKKSWTRWQRTSPPAIGTPLKIGSTNCSRGGNGSGWIALIDKP